MLAKWIWFLCVLPVMAGTALPGEGAQLGVYLQELDEKLMADLGFEGDGVLVIGLVEGGGAAKAGIEKGDIILFFNNAGVASTEALVEAISGTSPGDKVPVVVWSDGEVRSLKVKMGGKKEDVAFFPVPPDKPEAKFFGDADMSKWLTVHEEERPWLGTGLMNLNEQLHGYFEVKHGVLVTEVKKDSPARKAGLRAGDVIVRFDGRPVKNSDEIIQLLADREKGDDVDVDVVRRGKEKEFSLHLDRMVKPKGNVQTYSFRNPEGEEYEFKAYKDFNFIPPMPEFYSGKDMSELRQGMKALRKELEALRKELRALKRDR